MYGAGGLDDVSFVGDVHGLAFLWVEVHRASLTPTIVGHPDPLGVHLSLAGW